MSTSVQTNDEAIQRPPKQRAFKSAQSRLMSGLHHMCQEKLDRLCDIILSPQQLLLFVKRFLADTVCFCNA